MVGFTANDKKIYDLLNDKMYIVEANQRKYVWNKNNWQELLDDIDLVFKDQTNNHFIGSIVLKTERIDDGIRNHFSIIDGQQRISTLTILLCAIGFLFAENNRQDYFNGLSKPLFVNDNKNQPHPIVSKEANKSIANLVEALFFFSNQHFASGMPMIPVADLLKEANVSKIIEECFMFFYDWLKNTTASDMEILLKYREIIDDVRYIDIVAEEDEDAFTIFEILNARGQALTDFELLNNFLLKYAPKDQKKQTKKKLKEIEGILGSNVEVFLKHYAMHRYGHKTDKGENRPYKVITKAEKNKDKLMFLDDLLLKAKYYQKMTNYTECSALERKIFSFFKPRRQQQFRPLVMGLMHQKDLGHLDERTYNKNLEFLYEFFICYHVIGEQTSNKIEDIVYGYSQKIENAFSKSVLEQFKLSMIKRIPNEENFKRSIKRICFSNHWTAYSDNRKRENVRAIFEVIERELGYEGTFDNCNVEHCLPDAYSESNASIGNLMLLEVSLNQQSNSKPFEAKMNYYIQSKLNLPQKIAAECKTQSDFEMDSRSDWIAKTLYEYITRIKFPENDI